MSNIFPRLLESEALRLAGRFPIIGIVGPRQVGKTTLAKQLAAQLPKPTQYFDLEYPENWAALQEPVRLLERLEDHTVILDEVQRLPGIFTTLRALTDKRREPGRFILLGSASPELIQHSSETLAGRIAYLEMQPFALPELPPMVAWETLWLRGGFPESLFAPDERDSLDWRQSFVRSYVERDFPMLGLKADSVLLRRLWTMLAHLNGQMLNKESLTNAIGLNNATLNRYLDYFESAYLMQRLMPFATNLGKRLVKTPKIYLRDTGILHSLLNIQNYPALLGNPALGASWETFVLQQLLPLLPAGWEAFFYRTHEGAEVDFVLTNGGKPEILLECKVNTTPAASKGFYEVAADLNTVKNFIVSPVQLPFPGKNGVEIISPKQFLEIF
ncbi:MAG: ATP-binding protein [Saprospiraceae bacterium]